MKSSLLLLIGFTSLTLPSSAQQVFHPIAKPTENTWLRYELSEIPSISEGWQQVWDFRNIEFLEPFYPDPISVFTFPEGDTTRFLVGAPNHTFFGYQTPTHLALISDEQSASRIAYSPAIDRLRTPLTFSQTWNDTSTVEARYANITLKYLTQYRQNTFAGYGSALLPDQRTLESVRLIHHKTTTFHNHQAIYQTDETFLYPDSAWWPILEIIETKTLRPNDSSPMTRNAYYYVQETKNTPKTSFNVKNSQQTPETAIANDFSSLVAPNPFGNLLTLQLNVPLPQILQIDLLDLHGRSLNHWSLEASGNQTLNLDVAPLRLPSGSYLLRISHSKGLATHKLQKQ